MDFVQYWERIEPVLLRLFPRLLAVILILIILRYVVNFISRATHNVLDRVELAKEAEDLIARMASLLTIIAGIILILFVLGWGQLAMSFVAGLGISGLVIGFALQDITKNLAAGLLLLFQRPFRINDRIQVGSEEGSVEEIALRATTIRTDDGREVIIPNATIYTGTISHLTRYKYRRYNHSFTLKGDTPVQEAIATIQQTLAPIDGIVQELPIQVIVKTVKADNIDVEARFWLPSRYPQTAQVLSLSARSLRRVLQESGWLA